MKKWKKSANGRKLYSDCCKDFAVQVKAYARRQEEKCLRRGNVGQFYKFANSKLKLNKGIAPLKRSDGSITDCDVEKCNLLNEYFVSVFTVDDNEQCDFKRRVPIGVEKNHITITPNRVCKLLKKLPNKVSRSPDNLPALFLKKIAQFCKTNNCHECCICEPLSRIFAVSLYREEVPKCWLTAEVVPIFKKGLQSEAGNYRSVSLTSICCKLMETIVKQEIVDYLYSRKLLSRYQHGFLSKRSVCTQLLECTNDWTKTLDNRKSTDVVYLDFAKAFDTVCHRKLLHKLEGYRVSGSLLGWISAFLSGRTQVVRINDSFSECQAVTSGVPQGSVLGPLLFLLYVNDIAEIVSGVKIKLFADDIKIYAESCDGENKIQENLDRIELWAKKWQLNLACKKCVVLRIGKDKSDCVYRINDVPLENVSQFRDLGVLMSHDQKSSVHCQSIAATALSRVGILFRAFHTNNVDVLSKAYVTYIRPLLESATPIWSPHLRRDIECIERVQHVFTRKLFRRCGLGHPPYELRCSVLGLDSLQLRRIRFDLCMCYKLLNGLVDLSPNEFFHFASFRGRGHSSKLAGSFSRINTRKYHFTNRIIDIWNCLPTSVVETASFDSFHNGLRLVDLRRFCV